MEFLAADKIIQFIVLMIPGLFGYLAYQSFLPDEDEDRELKIIKIIAFAAPGYFLKDVPIWGLGSEKPLWLDFLITMLVSVVLGVVLGSVTERFGSPINFFARLAGALHWKPKRYHYNSMLEYLDQEYFRNKTKMHGYPKDMEICRIAKVYSIAHPDSFIFNEIESWNQRNDIVLDKVLEFSPQEAELIIRSAIFKFAIVKADAGVVIEVTCIDKKITDNIFEERYKQL